MDKVIPAHEEIRATFAAARERLSRCRLCLDTTIDDYPIGRRERGKCRLQVERVQGKGYRTVKTTTNKTGRWCAPKKSTYSSTITAVIEDFDGEFSQGWLYVGLSVSVGYAAGPGEVLAKFWRFDAPQRKDQAYSVTTSKPISLTAIMAGDKPEQGETEHHVLKADSDEEIAAWDVWAEELKTIRELALQPYRELVLAGTE